MAKVATKVKIWGGLGVLALGVGVVAKRLHSRRRSSRTKTDNLTSRLQTMQKAKAQLEEAVRKLDSECDRIQAEIDALKENGEGPVAGWESEGGAVSEEE